MSRTLPALVVALMWSGVILWLNWDAWKLDLTALYYAARSWQLGMVDLVYAPGPETFLVSPSEIWRDWALAEGWEEPYFTPYLYPPLWLAVFGPVAAVISAKAFFNAGLIAMVVSTLWLVRSGWALLRPRNLTPLGWAALTFGLLLTTTPGFMAYTFGQPQVIVSAVILAAVLALANGRDITAGGLLALATAAKLSPLLLLILFVMERRWRAVAAFVVIGGALGLLSIALTGWPLHAELLTKLSLIEERILVSRILVSFELGLFQLSELFAGRADWVIGHPYMVMEPAWITWMTRGLMLVGFAAVWAVTRGSPDRLRLWSRLMGVFIVATMASPLGWQHYLLLPMALLPGLLEVMTKRAALIAIAALALPLAVPVFLRIGDFGEGDLVQVIINMVVAFGMLALVLVKTKPVTATP